MILLKHRDRTCGQEELHCKCGGDGFMRGGGKREFLKGFSYAKDSQIIGGLAIVKLRLFFPLAKH